MSSNVITECLIFVSVFQYCTCLDKMGLVNALTYGLRTEY
jgi:hypothetical protein